MRVLRSVRGVTLRDRMRSDRIREDLGVESVLESVERGQLRWFGHVRRMGDAGVGGMYEWRPEGRRPVGRPRKRWRDAVEDAIRRRGGTMVEVEEGRVWNDRNNWRRFWRTST